MREAEEILILLELYDTTNKLCLHYVLQPCSSVDPF